jgi:type 1 glutamine amidotransferase
MLPAVAAAEEAGVSYPGGSGLTGEKKIVLVSGDEEYRSEEMLPQLGKILSVQHGFPCTALFAIDPKDGTINPNSSNIPGLEALDSADLLILFTRFRNLPDEQMKHFAKYVESGKPIIGIRTATHAFSIPQDRKYAEFSFDSKKWDGGFGRQILGETWINHHGNHGSQSTRGVIVEGQKEHPIVRGIRAGEIWGPTDVYGVRLPQPKGCEPVVLGQVLVGMKPDDAPLEGEKNNPMMPLAWTTSYSTENGKVGRVFTTTMGSAQDFESSGYRKLLVNATYWCLGLEDKLPAEAKVELVGEYKASRFANNNFVKGLKPGDHALKKGE